MKIFIFKFISCFLVFLLMTGLIVKALPHDRREPDNPLKTEAAELKTDIRSKRGAGKWQDTKENLETSAGSKETFEETKGDSEELGQEELAQKETREEKEVQEDSKVSKEVSATDNGKIEDGDEGTFGESKNENPQDFQRNEEGKLPTESGEEVRDEPGTGEEPGEDEHGLVTNLYDRIILFSELQDDTLNFYAYYSDADVEADIRVNYRHREEENNGIWLEKQGEHDYSARLSLGTNYITIYYTDGAGQRNWTRLTITYQADRADTNHPQRGENPPIIKTNLDDWTDDIRVFEFTFTVDAKKYDGTRIYNNNIQVWLDGESITNPTGTGIYEYVLRFGMPVEGNIENHTVSVLAWDDEGNSRYVSYAIRHRVNDEGTVIGSVTVEIDATTLGLGIIEETEIIIASGDTAAVAVIKMLEECGYTYTNSGALKNDFYLSSISRSDAFRGAAIEPRLRRLIERDGITLLPDSGRDKLGEFDYTRGSGWMYFLNGEYCPGKSMSSYTLNGGERISLRFTLAFGKDVGSSISDTNTTLQSYCGKWVNNTIIEYQHQYEQIERVEPTAERDGYIFYRCHLCKEEKQQALAYEGWEEEPPAEGEEPENGQNPPTEGEKPENGQNLPSEGGGSESGQGPEEEPPAEGEEPESDQEPPSGGGESESGQEPPSGGGESESGQELPSEGGESESGQELPSGGGESESGQELPSEGGEDGNGQESQPEENEPAEGKEILGRKSLSVTGGSRLNCYEGKEIYEEKSKISRYFNPAAVHCYIGVRLQTCRQGEYQANDRADSRQYSKAG